MALMFDARIPVVFGTHSDERDGDFVLDGGFDRDVSHSIGCSCCVQRSGAAEVLSRLFMRRARGEVAFFRRMLVIGDAAAEISVRAALQSDPVVMARFRLT